MVILLYSISKSHRSDVSVESLALGVLRHLVVSDYPFNLGKKINHKMLCNVTQGAS